MALLDVRAAVDTILQIGVEHEYGVRVAATRRLPGINISLNPQAEFQLFRARGFNVPTTSVPQKLWANGTWNGIADYNQVIYPLSGLVGITGAAPTTPGGATNARRWLFAPVSSGKDANPKSFTIEEGDSDAVQIGEGLKFSSFGLEWTNDASNMTGNLFARFPVDEEALTTLSDEEQRITESGPVTAGTFTITYSAQTTAALDFDATAAEIQTALEALSNLAPGDVVVSGGPIFTTPVTIIFQGTLAGTNVGAITVDSTSLTGGTYVPSTLTAGGAAVTSIPQSPVSRMHVDIFADDVFANLGDTKVTQAYAGDFRIGDKVQPFWALNTDYASFQSTVRTAADVTCSFSTPHNAQSRALYNAVRLNPWKWVRLLATGNEIDAGVNNESIRIDVAAKFGNPEKQEDANGVFGYKFNFNSLHNADFNSTHATGAAYEIEVINSLTAL